MTIIGMFLGGVVSILAARYHYRRSKRLVFFVQTINYIFTFIKPQIKSDLKIKFKDHTIEELYEIQFIVANTGNEAISNLIRPITMKIPQKGFILDYSIVYIHPTGREVFLKHDGTSISIDFPLLNSGEYFIFRLLVSGSLDLKNWSFSREAELFKFKISCAGLNPEITAKKLPFDFWRYSNNKRPLVKIEFEHVLTLLFLGFGFILYSASRIQSDLFILNFKEFFANFIFLKVVIILGWIIEIFLGLSTLSWLMDNFEEIFNFNHLPKFQLPEKSR